MADATGSAYNKPTDERWDAVAIRIYREAVIDRMGEPNPTGFRKLTRAEERVIVHKGTEPPFSGEYDHQFAAGTYVCKRCGNPLYESDAKFDSGCGWPAFDREVAGAVAQVRDPDGERTEIQCARCGAHLGHVFVGERLTARNVRHCVNSISMLFVPASGTAGHPPVPEDGP